MSESNRLKSLRDAKGLSLEVVADAAGLSPSYLSRLETGDRNLSVKNIAKLAEALGVRPRDIIDATGDDEPARSGYIPPPQTFVAKDMPIRGAAEGGPGEMTVFQGVIDYTFRPEFLTHVRDSYAVYVTGTSMEPRYEPGEKVYVHPRAPLVRDKDVILIANPNDADFRASIKRLVKWDDDHWTIKQYNPPREWKISRKEWPVALRVFGRQDF